MTRVCVTGGSGFIASWIVRGLLDEGHTVLAMDDCSGSSRGNLPVHERLYFSLIDLRSTSPTMFEIMEFKPDVIYHLAANAREGASFYQPISVVGRNTGAYTNVLTAGIKAGVKRVILFSSAAVYGDQKSPFREDMPKKPVDVYGLCKAQMEDMTQILAACHGFEWVIFRPHNVFGEGQALNDLHRNVFGIWMNQLMRGEKMTVYGGGEMSRAFSYIGDSLPCYLKAMDCELGQIFNIGGDSVITVLEAAIATTVAMGTSGEGIDFLPGRYGDVEIVYSDHTKARDKLGYDEVVGWRSGLRHMAAWAKERGPQKWMNHDELEIPNHLTPEHWRAK